MVDIFAHVCSACDATADPDMPIPICATCARQVAIRWLALHQSPTREEPREIPAEDIQPGPTLAELRARNHGSVVYYVRMRDGRIKIGYTKNIKSRCGGLRVSTSEVLATEPGGRREERARHLQFADLRVGRTEDFEPGDELLAHIEAVRLGQIDPPKTGWVAA